MGRQALSVLVLAAALIGCGTSNDKPNPKGGRATKGTIGVSVLTLTNPFFKVIGDTITEEAATHGYDVMVVSGDDNAATQQNQIRDFIVRKCAAIVLCRRMAVLSAHPTLAAAARERAHTCTIIFPAVTNWLPGPQILSTLGTDCVP